MDNLTALVDGALGEAEERSVLAHLETCSNCAAIVRDHRRIKQRLAGYAIGILAPAGLANAVGSRLDRMPRPRPPRWRSFGAPLAVALVGLTGGLWLARPAWQPRPLDVQAIVWHHRHALNPPPELTLRTRSLASAREFIRQRTGETSAGAASTMALTGVGVCRIDDSPAAIWMYLAPQPVSVVEVFRPVSLPRGGNARDHYRISCYGGYNEVIWTSGGHTWAMVSSLPLERMIRLMEEGGWPKSRVG
ncbi:MAG TPA: zf-HC2 domain-containing protein [Armatimonadota bacterium]